MLLIQNTQSFIELKQTFIFSSILLLIHTLGFWILNLLLPFIVCNLKALSTFSHTENTGMITLFEHYLIRLIQDRQLVMLNFPSSPSQTGNSLSILSICQLLLALPPPLPHTLLSLSWWIIRGAKPHRWCAAVGPSVCPHSGHLQLSHMEIKCGISCRIQTQV